MFRTRFYQLIFLFRNGLDFTEDWILPGRLSFFNGLDFTRWAGFHQAIFYLMMDCISEQAIFHSTMVCKWSQMDWIYKAFLVLAFFFRFGLGSHGHVSIFTVPYFHFAIGWISL
jgi:hypothetical protein